jgi:hypothetical protein
MSCVRLVAAAIEAVSAPAALDTPDPEPPLPSKREPVQRHNKLFGFAANAPAQRIDSTRIGNAQLARAEG